MKTGYEIIAEVLVLDHASTTSTSGGLYTDTILRTWLKKAHKWGAGFKKWPVTEGRHKTTFTGTEEQTYPEGWKPDSIRYMTIGGKYVQKVNFADYQRYREENSSGTDKIFSDFGLTYFVNPQADLSGTTVAYGQYTPADIDTTDDTAETVFSANMEEANEALVEEILSYAKQRENKQDESQLHHQRAMRILNEIWERIKDEGFGYHAHDRTMFTRVDVLDGGLHDELFKRDQF